MAGKPGRNPKKNPKKIRTQPYSTAPWVTGRARGLTVGRWAAGCSNNAAGIRWFLRRSGGSKKRTPGLARRPRGSPASQGDDSASDFDPQGRTGPRYDRGEFVQPSQNPNVADSREDRRRGSGPIQQPPPQGETGCREVTPPVARTEPAASVDEDSAGK
jgi:hypothetical protein